MPIYEYVCPSCDTRFEELRPVTRMDDAASCPKGHRRGQRVLSTFAAITRDAEGAVSSVAPAVAAAAVARTAPAA